MKKLLLTVIAFALSVSLFTGCGVGDVGGPGYQTSSQEAAASSQAAETASRANLEPDDYDANLEGLCAYFEDKGYVNTDKKTEMYAEVIGAKAGYKYETTVAGANYVVELYEFDTKNLNDQGSSTVEAVKADGFYMMVGTEIKAMLSDNGKYMMSYGDASEEEENKARREEIVKAFREFH